LPNVLPLKLRNYDSTGAVIFDKLFDLNGLMFEMRLGHYGVVLLGWERSSG
jgi:hypothetical protein